MYFNDNKSGERLSFRVLNKKYKGKIPYVGPVFFLQPPGVEWSEINVT